VTTEFRARLPAVARAVSHGCRAVWVWLAWGRQGRQPGRASWGLDALRRRYVFGGITRAELDQAMRKMRGRLGRGR
jgi:hypothetical protein